MFTIFREEMGALGRRLHHDHREFEAGRLDGEAVRSHQLAQLKKTVAYVRTNSPFYRERLDDWSYDAIEHLTFESFRQLPVTTKDDLRTRKHDLLSKPVSDAWVFYETTGTTGDATPCPRDDVDSLSNNIPLVVCYDSVFRQHGDRHVVAVMGPTELHSTGDTFGDVCHSLGHTVLKVWPHSPVVGFTRALDVLRDLDVSAVFCTPGMAISLAKEARKRGLSPGKDFAVRFFMLTGELASPRMLANLGAVWDAKAYNCLYASQEASVLAVARDDGLLRTVPLTNYYEVVDPATLAPAPVRAGVREGELVVTNLYQGCKPLVRYRTGDLVRLRSAAEGSDYPSQILQPLGRARDVLRLGGRPMNGLELEQTVLAHLPGCLDYYIVIDHEDGVDTVTVEIEPADGTVVPDSTALGRALERALGTAARVVVKEIGSITTTGAMVSWKAARIYDRRVTDDAEKRAAMAIAEARDSR